jgi:hypothetical protein
MAKSQVRILVIYQRSPLLDIILTHRPGTSVTALRGGGAERVDGAPVGRGARGGLEVLRAHLLRGGHGG